MDGRHEKRDRGGANTNLDAGVLVTPNPDLRTSAAKMLATLCPPEEARQRARELGVVRRQGKVDAYALLVVVTLGLVTQGPVTIAQLGQLFARCTGVSLARSAFWSRLSPEFARLVAWLLDGAVADSRRNAPRPPGVLAVFRDVLVADASVQKVHDALRPVWKGTRKNSAAAALKIHAWIRAFTGELVKYRITPEAFADCKAFGIDHDLRGTLMLFDRGYASPSLWRRIDSVGGYFLTRIPAGWNPVVLSENRRHRGRARKLAGMKLRDALDGLHRSIVDVDCEFWCRVRGYAGAKSRKVSKTFRVLAIRHPSSGEYSLYATNASQHLVAARDVREVYRLRWEVETFFKTVKSGSALNEQPSQQPHIVEILTRTALLRATLAMRVRAGLLGGARGRRDLRIHPHQWVRWWNALRPEILSRLLGPMPALDMAQVLALLEDPNRQRRPTRYAFADD